MHLYDEIGVTRVINASGSMTYLGGSLISGYGERIQILSV